MKVCMEFLIVSYLLGRRSLCRNGKLKFLVRVFVNKCNLADSFFCKIWGAKKTQKKGILSETIVISDRFAA